MSALHELPERRYTIEEFEAMDFGDRIVELIDGLIVFSHAFPNDIHGLITENLSFQLRLALEACGDTSCRPIATSALRIKGHDHGLPNDNDLGPDLTVKCRDNAGQWLPSLIVEVLSKSNTAEEIADKLRAYKAVPTIQDVIYFSQSKYYAVHHRRRNGQWLAGLDLAGLDAEIVIERWNARIRLERIYEMAFPWDGKS
jgi:Uma2 family endonuclease